MLFSQVDQPRQCVRTAPFQRIWFRLVLRDGRYLLLLTLVFFYACGSRNTSGLKLENMAVDVQRPVMVALVQMSVTGGKPDENIERALIRIREAAEAGADIALLPEAMDLGWTHPSALNLAEPIPGGKRLEQLCRSARDNGIFVCAGLIEKQGDRAYNAAVLIDDRGRLLLHHRKLNELDIAHHLYAQGDRLAVARTPFGTIGLHICADATASGHVITRSLGYMGADLILSPCSWAVPPDHDNLKDPYGDTWRNAYMPSARDFGMWIIGVSNVGSVDSGAWAGWKCIGASLAVDAGGREVLQGPYGEKADTLLLLPVQLQPRPARGTGWHAVFQRRAESD
jgi:predicted amidohydrolase